MRLLGFGQRIRKSWMAALVAAFLTFPVRQAFSGQFVSRTFFDGQVFSEVAGVRYRDARAVLTLDESAREACDSLDDRLDRAWMRAVPPPCFWPSVRARLFNPGIDQPWGRGVTCAVAPIHPMPEARYGLSQALREQPRLLP